MVSALRVDVLNRRSLQQEGPQTESREGQSIKSSSAAKSLNLPNVSDWVDVRVDYFDIEQHAVNRNLCRKSYRAHNHVLLRFGIASPRV